MKKRLLFIVMAALCLNTGNAAFAQTPGKTPANQAIDVTTKGLQIGDKLPENLPLRDKYKGKLIILDFWATWCSPCVAMIPKLDALQKQFDSQIQIVQVTYQSTDEVNTFLNKLSKGRPQVLPQINADKELHKLFPHIYLPHYVWINKEGKVKAITGSDEINADNIDNMLKNNEDHLMLTQKRDMKVAYDKARPFLINGNGGDGGNMIYHSVFSGYIEGLNGRSAIRKASATIPGRIVANNVQLTILYGLAYGNQRYFGTNRIMVNAKSRGAFYFNEDSLSSDDWKHKNRFCYELILPQGSGDIYQCMRQDLKRMLPQYTASVITKKAPCLVLISTGNLNKLAGTTDSTANISISMSGAKLANTSLDELLKRLEMVYLQNLPYPLVNGTGFSKGVNLELNANMTSIASINNALAAYGLELKQMEATTEYLQISDK